MSLKCQLTFGAVTYDILAGQNIYWPGSILHCNFGIVAGNKIIQPQSPLETWIFKPLKILIGCGKIWHKRCPVF